MCFRQGVYLSAQSCMLYKLLDIFQLNSTCLCKKLLGSGEAVFMFSSCDSRWTWQTDTF